MSTQKTTKDCHQSKHIDYPGSFRYPEFWDETDEQMLKEMIDQLNQQGLPQAWLSNSSGVDKSLINQMIKGTYKASPKNHLVKALDTIERHLERKNITQLPFIDTSVYELLDKVCTRARTMNQICALTGLSGIGKTRSLKEYAKRHSNTIFIEPNPLMGKNALLDELVKKTKATVETTSHYNKGTAESRFRAIINKVKNSDLLIIMDEANTANSQTLEYLRRIHDLANIGVVLVGTDALHTLIHGKAWQFDQMRNRITYWPQTLEQTTVDDCTRVINAGFADYLEADQESVDKDILKHLWNYHAGNMRVLCESLIPTIIDVGLKGTGNTLSVTLIDAIAQKVLSITPVVNKG
jgi:DNA transposition AAA+ family ATPase